MCVPQGSVLVPTLFFVNINELLSTPSKYLLKIVLMSLQITPTITILLVDWFEVLGEEATAL